MALFGEDVATMSNRDRSRARRRIGMIYQDLRLADELDAYGNIALAVRAAGGDQIARGPDIEETLAWLGLAKSEGRPAGDLAAKARRRLALARAVINRPDLLIADEPFGEGDDGILGLLRDVNRGGTAVLLATADLSVAARVGGVRLEWPGASTPPSRRDDPEAAP
jgi:cell division transport system ATP-binding protein